MRKIVIAGAAGRDFHNFNVVFRGREDVEVVAFTATQIPDIDGRRYPPELAGPALPEGIPILPEAELPAIVRGEGADEVVFAYSDVPHEHVMHVGSIALAAGADYRLLGPAATDDPLGQARRRGLRGPDRLGQEPDHAPRGGRSARRGQARRGAPPPDAVRRPHEAGRAALRALRRPRRGRLHDRGAGGVRAAPRGGEPRLRRNRLRRHPLPQPRRRRT